MFYIKSYINILFSAAIQKMWEINGKFYRLDHFLKLSFKIYIHIYFHK